MASPAPQTTAVPLIPSGALTEFGHVEAEAIFSDPTIMDRDHSYVPGWSELRRARDVQMAEAIKGTRAKTDVAPLPVNLRWARNQDKSGVPDSVKVFGHGRKGYRLVDAKKDMKQPWLTELPPGASVGADGTIRNGDCVLMVCSAQDAAKSELAKRYETDRRLTGVTNTFAQNLKQANVNAQGADPYIEKLPAQPVGK